MDASKELEKAVAREATCRRLMVAMEHSGLRKGEFARLIGISGPSLSNVLSFRNLPPRTALEKLCELYGFTMDYFYTGAHRGMDKKLVKRILLIEPVFGLTKPRIKVKAGSSGPLGSLLAMESCSD